MEWIYVVSVWACLSSCTSRSGIQSISNLSNFECLRTFSCMNYTSDIICMPWFGNMHQHILFCSKLNYALLMLECHGSAIWTRASYSAPIESLVMPPLMLACHGSAVCTRASYSEQNWIMPRILFKFACHMLRWYRRASYSVPNWIIQVFHGFQFCLYWSSNNSSWPPCPPSNMLQTHLGFSPCLASRNLCYLLLDFEIDLHSCPGNFGCLEPWTSNIYPESVHMIFLWQIFCVIPSIHVLTFCPFSTYILYIHFVLDFNMQSVLHSTYVLYFRNFASVLLAQCWAAEFFFAFMFLHIHQPSHSM